MSESDSKTFLPKVPECLVSPVTIGKTIDIWTGPATLEVDSVQVQGDGHVYLNLTSPSHIQFSLTAESHNPVELMSLKGPSHLRTGAILGDLPCQLTGELSSSSNATIVSGTIDVDASKSYPNEHFTTATYLVLNGPAYRGLPIKQDRCGYLGRICHTNGKMLVTLDKVHQSIESETHYRVSHLARLEFANPVGLDLIDAHATNLFRSLSLMKGGWVGLVGPWLLGSDGEPIRVVPYARKVVRNQGQTPWFHESDQEGFGQVFDCLQSAYDDVTQREAVQTAFHWLIESEQCAGAVEGSLILQQCAFECLAWLVIVQKRKLCSTSGFKGLPAADKIRLLLSTFNIDYSIPAKSAGIAAYAKAFTLTDLIEVFVDVRNALVHAEPNKAQRLVRPDHERSDLWYQVGCLLQQAFLAVIGYQGKFVNRAVAAQYAVGGLQQVPWGTDRRLINENNHP